MAIFLSLTGLRTLLAAAALALCATAASGAEISAVRVAAEDGGARVVIESDERLDYRMFSLAEGTPRLVLDFPIVDWRGAGEPAGAGQVRADGAGLVSQYRFARNNSPTTSRLVLDLSGPTAVAGQYLLRPSSDSPNYRLVLDLEPTSGEQFAASEGVIATPVAEGAPAAAGMGGPQYVLAEDDTPDARITSAEPATAPAARRIIVIDAGHGGHDPGTTGRNGNHEKSVTLAAALQLRDILQATGRYDVVLTRSTDVYLAHDDRVDAARRAGANLFISLHADSIANPNTRGATVYTVNERGQDRTRQKVRSNSWSIVEAPQTQEVGNILLDLSMTDTKNQSSAFAEILRENVSAVSTMVQNPHREDNFYVLLAPDVPAVLLEMGFMSNPHDEANLISIAYRQTLMSAVARAIDLYFSARPQLLAGN